MNGDGVSIERYVAHLRKSAGGPDLVAAWVVGVDPEGRRRCIWGAWPSRLFARFEVSDHVDDQRAVAMVTSLADRFHLEAGS